jgi:C-terminal processing protease CtpA/Prc
MSPEELKDKIDEILWTIPDNHMEAHLNYKCSPLRQSNRRNGDAGANAINSNSKVWQVRMDRRDDLSILYVSIRHFSPPGKAVWHGFLPEIKKKLSSSQLLVLDLRGNTGGDDRMGLKLAKICFGNKLNTAYARTIRSQTPETFALTANYFRRLQLSYELSGKKAPNNLNKKYEHFLQKMHRSENAHQVDEKVEAEVTKNYEFNATKGYDKPIYILMDGATASASESIIDTFEFQPNTKKVGRNTCGANHYGDCGELLLPNSKVEVAIPTAHRDYKDKRFIERIGIKPDLQVAKGQDAYSVAIEDYKKQALLPIR